jgi:hypothetical protein
MQIIIFRINEHQMGSIIYGQTRIKQWAVLKSQGQFPLIRQHLSWFSFRSFVNISYKDEFPLVTSPVGSNKTKCVCVSSTNTPLAVLLIYSRNKTNRYWRHCTGSCNWFLCISLNIQHKYSKLYGICSSSCTTLYDKAFISRCYLHFSIVQSRCHIGLIRTTIKLGHYILMQTPRACYIYLHLRSWGFSATF